MGRFRPPIQCLPRPLSSRLMWWGREVWLIHPHNAQSETLWSYTSFSHYVFVESYTTKRRNSIFNWCGIAVAIIVDTASLTRDTLYLKSFPRLSCNSIFANSVLLQN
jgi:hypothetical protein